MRRYEEMKSDLGDAMDIQDVAWLNRLTDELQQQITTKTEVLRQLALSFAMLLGGRVHNSI